MGCCAEAISQLTELRWVGTDHQIYVRDTQLSRTCFMIESPAPKQGYQRLQITSPVPYF